jgi:hypothetical protein
MWFLELLLVLGLSYWRETFWYVAVREEWLRRNHAGKRGIWLVYYKQHTGRPLILMMTQLKRRYVLGVVRISEKRRCPSEEVNLAGAKIPLQTKYLS